MPYFPIHPANFYHALGAAMLGRKRIEERIRRKEEEIQELEAKIREARAYTQALHDALRMLPRESAERIAAERVLRRGSAMADAREAILTAGKPLHISEILEALGRAKTRASRAALAGSISAYVRKGEVFTRPLPNTFGLVELGHGEIEQEPELPADFGKDRTASENDDEIPY
jgi:hypothetical protein